MSNDPFLATPILRNEDVFESSFQTETNQELNRIMESAFDADWSPNSDLNNLLPRNAGGSSLHSLDISSSPIKQISSGKKISPIKPTSSVRKVSSTPVKSMKSSNPFLGNKWRDSFHYSDQQDYLGSSLGNRLSTSSDFFDSSALIQSISDKIESTMQNNTTSSSPHDRIPSVISISSTSTSGKSQRLNNVSVTPAVSQNSVGVNTILSNDLSNNATNTRDKPIFANAASALDYNLNSYNENRKITLSRSSTSTSLNSSPRKSLSFSTKNGYSFNGSSTRFSLLDNDIPILKLRSRQNSSSLSIGSTNNININSRRYSVVSNGSKKIIIKKRSPSVVQRTTNRRLSMNSASYRKIIMDNEGNRSSVLRNLPHRPSLSTIPNSPEVTTFNNSLGNFNSNLNISEYNNSPPFSRIMSSPSITDLGHPLKRTVSESSSLIGYRYSTRSFSATIADSSMKFFDTFSLACDDEGVESAVIDDSEYCVGSSFDRNQDAIEIKDDDVLIYDDSMTTAKYAIYYDRNDSFVEGDSYKMDHIKTKFSNKDNNDTKSYISDMESINSVSSRKIDYDNSHDILSNNDKKNLEEKKKSFEDNNKAIINTAFSKSLNSMSNQGSDKINNSSSCTDFSTQDQPRSSLSSLNLLSLANTNISSDNSINKKDKKVYIEGSSNSSTMFGSSYNQNPANSVKSSSSLSSSIIDENNNKQATHSRQFSVSKGSINGSGALHRDEEQFKNKPRKSNFVKSLFNNNKNKKYGHKSNRSISGKLGGSVSQMVSSFSNKDFFGVNKENDNDIDDEDFNFSIINNTPSLKNNTDPIKLPKYKSQASTEILSSGDLSKPSNSHLKTTGSLFDSEDFKDNSKYKNLTQKEVCLFNATPVSKICKQNNIEYVHLYKLMTICESPNNLIFHFEDFINLRISQEDGLKFKKITDSSCVEYFSETLGELGLTKSFLKIVPFGESSRYHDNNPSLLICESIENLYREIKIYKLLRNCQGFPNLVSSQMVRGKFLETLLSSWDNSISLNSTKFRPDIYKKEQLYLIQTFNVSGTCLRDFKLKNWKQANKIFWNLVIVLKSSEVCNEFEHRDLNWENILVNDGGEEENGGDGSEFISFLQVTLTGFKYARLTDENRNVIWSDLLPMLKDFEETSDLLRYEIYKKMINDFFMDKDWSKHVKKTNLLWLYYVAYKLFYCKGLSEPEPCYNMSSTIVLSSMYEDAFVSSDEVESNAIYNIKEVESYNALKYVLRSLNPFNKAASKLKLTPGYDCADPFGAIYSDNNLVLEYRKNRLREDVNLDNFNNMEDVLKWGEINRMTTWVIGG